MMASANEILFVSRDHPDDETRRLLESRGFQMTMLDDVTKASQSINERRLSAIVLDVRIGSDAIDFIRSIRGDEHPRMLPVLAIGEWGTGEPTLALSAGADGFEPTPLQPESLLTSIERLIMKRGLAAGAND